jgi:hypothetical protein
VFIIHKDHPSSKDAEKFRQASKSFLMLNCRKESNIEWVE